MRILPFLSRSGDAAGASRLAHCGLHVFSVMNPGQNVATHEIPGAKGPLGRFVRSAPIDRRNSVKMRA